MPSMAASSWVAMAAMVLKGRKAPSVRPTTPTPAKASSVWPGQQVTPSDSLAISGRSLANS